MKKIVITPVLNGFKARVGCQEVLFTSIEKLCEELARYQNDPVRIEKEYLENALKKKLTPVDLPVPPAGAERPSTIIAVGEVIGGKDI